LRLNGTRHAGGSGANHQHVKVVAFVFHESFILQGERGSLAGISLLKLFRISCYQS
jgi:hypothetical protein